MLVVAENSWRWVCAFFGVQMAGGVCVPVNTRLGPKDLHGYLQDADPTAVLGDPEYLSTLGEPYRTRSNALENVFPDSRPDPRAEILNLGRAGQPSVIAYTSGTTGEPKGVLLAQDAVAGSGAIMAAVFNSSHVSRTAVMVPLFHNTGFVDAVMQMCTVGGVVEVHARFKPKELRMGLIKRGISVYVGVPTMYVRLLEECRGEIHENVSPWLGYGGAGMTIASIARLARVFPSARLVNLYGMSETTSLTHYLPWHHAEGRWDSVGVPVPGTLDRLADPKGSEIEIHSPTMMLGYWQKDEATSAKLVDGWLKTGDLGTRDESGMLRIVGRSDDIINRGGDKIAPFEIESALMLHPDITEACVVGVSDLDLGEAVGAAFVAPRGISESNLRDHLKQHLADFKMPMYYLRVDSFPRNSHGKIVRHEVQEQISMTLR